jgi:hypothetical protein
MPSRFGRNHCAIARAGRLQAEPPVTLFPRDLLSATPRVGLKAMAEEEAAEGAQRPRIWVCM